jgi:hypothetical protein
MWDAQIAELAASQFNRVARRQLRDIGLTEDAIAHRVSRGRLIIVHEGVFALPPLLHHDERGKWMGATLTAPGSRLSLDWAGYAWGWWRRPSGLISVTRPGSGGPRCLSGVMTFRSTTVAGESTELDGIPITSPERTLLDKARSASNAYLARGVREAVRLNQSTLESLAAFVRERRHRRGARRLEHALVRYSGLPVDRARSSAEIRALEVIRKAERPMPQLNVKVAGEEADLVWPEFNLIVEIDGGPFHQDLGEDARKEAAWRGAGWEVRRIPSDDVYARPDLLLSLSARNLPRVPR